MEEEVEIESSLNEVLDSGKFSAPTQRAMLLQVMRCIDEAFERIHPRSRRLAPSIGGATRVPIWLQRANDLRLESGFYAESGDWRLVPRGPLCSMQRGENASYADSLADRFAFLSVVPLFVQQEVRDISVSIIVIDESVIGGVPGGGRQRGHEVLCAVPIAEERDHLDFVEDLRGETVFVSYGPADDGVSAQRMIDAVIFASAKLKLDIVVAPEFVLPPRVIEIVQEGISGLPDSVCRMILAGSGNTDELDDGQPWNEAILLNGAGTRLWTQRKVLPASIDKSRAAEYGMGSGAIGHLFEDNASGSHIQVADVESIGRCLVLICQDFESPPMAAQLIQLWQPDWVFVPILDRGLGVGGWFHQQALNLSKYCKARFVAVSSVALPRAGVPSPLPCVMVACSLSGDGTVPSGGVSIKAAETTGGAGFATIDFESEAWLRSDLGSKPYKRGA